MKFSLSNKKLFWDIHLFRRLRKMVLYNFIKLFELPASHTKKVLLFAFSIFFIGAGLDHLVNPEFYLSIMPPIFPMHSEAVLISGVLEIVGGIAALMPGLRRAAGWGIFVLLIAVYPANIYMALYPELFPSIHSGFLYFRLPLQFLFLYWAYSVTRF